MKMKSHLKSLIIWVCSIRRSNMNKRKYIQLFFLICTIACIAFIWINSSLDGKESSEISGGLLGSIKQFLATIGISKTISEFFLRKIAHFTEFAGLSYLLTTDFKLIFSNFKKYWDKVLFCGLFVAVVDETIQLFPIGRSSKVSDVWIDFAGVLSALIVTELLYKLLAKRNIIKF